MSFKLKYSVLLFSLWISISMFGQEIMWKKTKGSTNFLSSKIQSLEKNKLEFYELQVDKLKDRLKFAPKRTGYTNLPDVIVQFPNISGKMENFRVVETQVLSPEIAQKYPNIKTYLGFSLDNPGTRIRFSVTPQGLQSMISYPDKESVFIAPQKRGGDKHYVAYSRSSDSKFRKNFECLTENQESISNNNSQSIRRDANDKILRTFRIAISTNAEYTNHWDDGNDTNGTAEEDAFAQVVATLNRNNEVFEVDMAITFQLVTGTELIYTNSFTDPYSTSSSFNTELQTTLTNNVGESNYDIGHLFAKAGKGGNAGCIGCVCVDSQKGSGYSAHDFLNNDGGPFMSDFFDIDYVPHEIGHQMGALHTHSQADNNSVNFEPGSGTTIMGYAGITGDNDIQDHSDPYFHYGSINQILNNLTNKSCFTTTNITNNPPIANAGNDYTIPAGTAFVLRGSATDVDGSDILTYTWEQIDDGYTERSDFGPTLLTGPLWRSRPPSTNPNRYMPVMTRILSGQLTETNPLETVNNTSWETVSTVSRDLNFALTVRDRSEANGLGQFPQSDFDFMKVTVDDTAGPFRVTSQSTNEAWDIGTAQTITWDVAGTDSGNINASNVNILLSLDGGQTFSTTIATNTPNDGNHRFVVPDLGGNFNQVRVMVEASDNIFFAVNESNFSISESEFSLALIDDQKDICKPNNLSYTFTYNTFNGFNALTTFNASGLPSGITATFSPTSATVDNTNVTLTLSGVNTISTQSYPFTISGVSGSLTKNVSAVFNVYDTNLTAPNLVSPANAASNVLVEGTLNWSDDTNAESYLVEIATDNLFNATVVSASVSTNSFAYNLLSGTQYYWRVTPSNPCTNGVSSSVFSFTTVDISCNSFSALDLPITITTEENITYRTGINIGPNFVVTDVNVTIDITHSFTGDLDIFLLSPQGTRVELTTDNGASGDNYTNTVFDQDASNSIVSASPPFTGTFRPEGDLSILNGEMSAGNWILEVTDDFEDDGGSIDAFSIELCVQGDILSNDDLESDLNDFKLYPNPSSGNFTLRFNQQKQNDVNVRVFDLSGRTIFSKKYESATSQFSENIVLNRVSSGIYLVQITSGTSKTTKKLIIE